MNSKKNNFVMVFCIKKEYNRQYFCRCGLKYFCINYIWWEVPKYISSVFI